MPIYLYKKIGKTPNELIDKYKLQNKDAKKVSFAGRLDPMAHGKMMLLVNEECKKQDLYLGQNKIYEFEILYGFNTDTYDVLGLLTEFIDPSSFGKKIDELNLQDYVTEFEQEYPPYSSIVVNKKPLWEWSKMGLINTINIPSKLVTIYNLEEIDNRYNTRNYDELYQTIYTMIYSLSYDNLTKFRVDSIIKLWKSFFDNLILDKPPIIKKYRAKVSSGTYIRSLSKQIGDTIGCGALALNIKRIDFT